MANPSVTTLQFQIDGSQFKYIDLSQCASLVNRRFYRQGLNWAVAGFTVMSGSNSSGRVLIEKLPDTWIMANAWTMGFKNWRRQQMDAASESMSVIPKFADFKVFMDDVHHQAGTAANAIPISYDNTAFALGDWDYSKFVIPNGGTGNPGSSAEREIICIGANYPGNSPSTGLNAVSLIEGYAARRALPYETDPNVPDDAESVDGSNPQNWIQAIYNEGTSQIGEVLDNLLEDNIQAPYPFENDGNYTDTMYPGGANNVPKLELHDFAEVSGTTVGQRTFLRGGSFQCGLMKVSNNTTGGDTDIIELLVHLVPGRSRGYLTAPMQEVN
jgi:hypothetical protein